MTLSDILAWTGASAGLVAYAFAFRSVLTATHPSDAGLSARSA